MWAKKTSTRSMSFVTRFTDVTRIQAVRARGGLRFKLVVEVVAQHRQAVEGHEVSGELLEVAGTALEEAENHGAHNE